jgi:heme-degrading monooxygenase HmoA
MNEERPWTLGIWTVKDGQEDAFREVWTSFAEWTARHQRGALEAYLLQNPQEPQQFFTFGPWEDNEAVAKWRSRPEFEAFVARARKVCDEFRPYTLHLVAHIEPRPKSR